MKKDDYKTDVMFRKDITKNFKGEIFAVFPNNPDTYEGNVTTYQHVGQHSTGDYQVCLQQSKPATAKESADLKREMEGIGYDLNVVCRQNREKYLKELQKIRQR